MQISKFQDPSRTAGLLPPPPLLPSEMLPMPGSTAHINTVVSSSSFPPPLPPPPVQQPMYQYQPTGVYH